MNRVPRIRGSLHAKLLMAHLAVITVGLGTVLLATELIASPIFSHLMDHAMGGTAGTMSMMSGRMSNAMRRLTDDAFREALTVSILIGAGAAVLAAGTASVLVSRRITRPIDRLALAARRIAAGRYAERVPIEEQDELGQLATSFNEMAATLEATERRRLELIGDVAHELRTPITNLQGYLEGLLDGVVEATPQTWAFLHGEAGRLKRLVEDLQDLSRAEARQMPVNLRRIPPARIAEQAAARLASELAQKPLALECCIPQDLSDVLADEDRAVQVLTNLLTNALRYTPAGGRLMLTLASERDAVRFSVQDTGVGIAPEHLPHLFERFYRVDKSRSRAAGGTGVGLTIARALVEAMGGRMGAESPGLGQGATFWFTLPLAR